MKLYTYSYFYLDQECKSMPSVGGPWTKVTPRNFPQRILVYFPRAENALANASISVTWCAGVMIRSLFEFIVLLMAS